MTTETNIRLEVIKTESECEKIVGVKYMSIRLHDFDFLIQQAERAREMEDYCSKSANFINQVELEKENAHLREALQSASNSLGADIEDYL